MSRWWLCAVVLFGIAACKQPKIETPTSGHLAVLATESLVPLIQKEAEEFHRLYPDANVTVSPASTREAIVQMLNGGVRGIVTDRSLNTEEREVARQYDIEITETKIAEDALAVLVHNRNPIKNISLQSLEKIITRKTTDWAFVPESGYSGKIELCLTGRNSGAYELLTHHFFQTKEEIVPQVISDTQHGVFEYVATHQRAVGVVSLATLNDTVDHPQIRTFRTLTHVLAVGGADSATSNTFVKLHQANVYRLLYPLHYPIFIYSTTKNTGVAAGFSAFVASVPGQKILLNAGLVPATMPVRLVQVTQDPL